MVRPAVGAEAQDVAVRVVRRHELGVGLAEASSAIRARRVADQEQAEDPARPGERAARGSPARGGGRARRPSSAAS